jgi:hypothetical protein
VCRAQETVNGFRGRQLGNAGEVLLVPVTVLVHEEDSMSPKLQSAAPAPIDKEVIRLAYVGCGFMAQNVHLPNFSLLSDCTLAALVEKRAKLARKVAERFSVAKVYQDHRELLEVVD